MEFKIDENLPVEIAELLVSAGHDAKTVNNQKLQGVKDPVLIDLCSKEQRCMSSNGFGQLSRIPKLQVSDLSLV
jgi:predicted nuclease of predicted toxin-antitoxin system